MNYTFVKMDISAEAWDEIAAAMKKAGYDHVFQDIPDDDGGMLPGRQTAMAQGIDMQGICVVRSPGLRPFKTKKPKKRKKNATH